MDCLLSYMGQGEMLKKENLKRMKVEDRVDLRDVLTS